MVNTNKYALALVRSCVERGHFKKLNLQISLKIILKISRRFTKIRYRN